MDISIKGVVVVKSGRAHPIAITEVRRWMNCGIKDRETKNVCVGRPRNTFRLI